MGSASSMFSATKSKSRTAAKLPLGRPEEERLLQDSIHLAEEELENVRRQAEISKFLGTQLPGYFDSAEAASDPEAFRSSIEAMFGKTRGDIDTAAENALRLGEADIQRQTTLGLEGLRDTLAPERGLRPGDSPILGLGSDITREGLFQQGQLVRGIRGGQAELLASLPLAASQFQAELTDRAFQNRLALAGTGAQTFLGIQPNANIPSIFQSLIDVRKASADVRTKGKSAGGSSELSYTYSGGGM